MYNLFLAISSKEEDANLRYVRHNLVCNSTLSQAVRPNNLPPNTICDALSFVDVET
jgi:hypothetical protein